MDVVLTWPAVDERRTRLAEGWCPAQGHPALVALSAGQSPAGPAGLCPRCGLIWALQADVVTVTLPDAEPAR